MCICPTRIVPTKFVLREPEIYSWLYIAGWKICLGSESPRYLSCSCKERWFRNHLYTECSMRMYVSMYVSMYVVHIHAYVYVRMNEYNVLKISMRAWLKCKSTHTYIHSYLHFLYTVLKQVCIRVVLYSNRICSFAALFLIFVSEKNTYISLTLFVAKRYATVM